MGVVDEEKTLPKCKSGNENVEVKMYLAMFCRQMYELYLHQQDWDEDWCCGNVKSGDDDVDVFLQIFDFLSIFHKL